MAHPDRTYGSSFSSRLSDRGGVCFNTNIRLSAFNTRSIGKIILQNRSHCLVRV